MEIVNALAARLPLTRCTGLAVLQYLAHLHECSGSCSYDPHHRDVVTLMQNTNDDTEIFAAQVATESNDTVDALSSEVSIAHNAHLARAPAGYRRSVWWTAGHGS